MPGVPTALMPFYGQTPDEAAHQLCAWLTRAYARAATGVASTPELAVRIRNRIQLKVRLYPQSGPVAQLGARMNGIHEVAGSIPAWSTNLSVPISFVRSS